MLYDIAVTGWLGVAFGRASAGAAPITSSDSAAAGARLAAIRARAETSSLIILVPLSIPRLSVSAPALGRRLTARWPSERAGRRRRDQPGPARASKVGPAP